MRGVDSRYHPAFQTISVGRRSRRCTDRLALRATCPWRGLGAFSGVMKPFVACGWGLLEYNSYEMWRGNVFRPPSRSSEPEMSRGLPC